MAKVTIPSFGEVTYSETRENNSSVTFAIPQSDKTAFDDYCTMLKTNGWSRREARNTDTHAYAAYQNGTDAIFLNYYESLHELYLVTEEQSAYFDFADVARADVLPTTLTQMELEDFGMSYVIRLSDGRFIIIDGGRNFESDRQKLLNHLKSNSPDERPVIAAWLLTHPHSDHFHLFVGFMEEFRNEVTLEKVLFLFPEHDDLAHYPKFTKTDKRFDYNTSAFVWIPRMHECIQNTGAKVYHPHSGQIYRIGNATLEYLVCMDDTMHLTENANAISPVIRMEIEGQIILFGTDAAFSIAQLAQKYGSYLKADILQIPHHGFQSGTSNGEIDAYKLIKPSVCLLPVVSYNAYTAFCAHRESARFLMTTAGIDELITGDRCRTLTLPYTASEYGKIELQTNYRTGVDACGAKAWVFTGLNTGNPEDFEFTLLNMTHTKPTVWIELFFESKDQCIRHIKAEMDILSMKKLSIVGDEVDPDALYFNWLSLKKQGIPENADFSVRFLSSVPIVVSHKHHKASYTASAQ